MTFYQELQLNQAGSNPLLKIVKRQKKNYIIFLFISFKVFINVAFCVAFVTAYSMIFGNDNSIVGVVILLCILVFRNVDLGIHAPQKPFCHFSAISFHFIYISNPKRKASHVGGISEDFL